MVGATEFAICVQHTVRSTQQGWARREANEPALTANTTAYNDATGESPIPAVFESVSGELKPLSHDVLLRCLNWPSLPGEVGEQVLACQLRQQ